MLTHRTQQQPTLRLSTVQNLVAHHEPSIEDVQKMDGSVWQTVKEYMVHHGVAHPSNADVTVGMLDIAKANGVEISGHGQHLAEGMKHFVDTQMQQGTPLHGFDSLKGIVEKAGGHALGAHDVVTSQVPHVVPHAVAPGFMRSLLMWRTQRTRQWRSRIMPSARCCGGLLVAQPLYLVARLMFCTS